MTEEDIVIIGGGVVGCTVLFHLTNLGYRCCLLEKQPHLVSQASAGNSGMLHTGFDAPLNSLELQCIQKCQHDIFRVLDSLNLPYSSIGATMVAWNDQQKAALPEIMQKTKIVGTSDAIPLSLSELYQREPHLSQGATGALWIPGETVVDPWLTPMMFAHHSKKKGAKIFTDTLVQNCCYDNGSWTVTTNRKTFQGKVVINCAGLYGDIVDKIAGFQHFRIKPRKGQYLIYHKSATRLINSSILPVPTEKTKGVIVFKTVYDSVVVGPTAEDIEQRETPVNFDPMVTSRLLRHGQSTVPELVKQPVVRMYTGNRPATETKDYHIIPHVEKNWLTVGGIRSTGLSSCLGISDLVANIVKEKFNLEPHHTAYKTLDNIAVRFSNHGSAFLDNEEYHVTHPLTSAGKFDVHANL